MYDLKVRRYRPDGQRIGWSRSGTASESGEPGTLSKVLMIATWISEVSFMDARAVKGRIVLSDCDGTGEV